MKSTILQGNCLDVMQLLPSDSVHCCVTSPPYFGLRNYGVEGQIGLEPTPAEFVEKMVEIFREVRRILRPDGTLWLNLGDSYANSGKGRNADTIHYKPTDLQSRNKGSLTGALKRTSIADAKPKDLLGIPWRVALALQADGWYLRRDIIWHKPNAMPESVIDRPSSAHEYIFLFSKNTKYYYDSVAIREPRVGKEKRPDGVKRNRDYGYDSKYKGTNLYGIKSDKQGKTGRRHAGFNARWEEKEQTPTRNKRSVWTIATQCFTEAHFATFPSKLIEPCILAGAPPGGIILDPFFGAGTTGLVAVQHGRQSIGIELNPEYITMAEKRINSLIAFM